MKCNVQCALQLCESTARIPFIYQMSWTSTLASLRYGSSLCCCCCLYFIFSSISIPSIAQPSFFLFLIIISHEMVWSLIVFVCELFSFLCCFFVCVCLFQPGCRTSYIIGYTQTTEWTVRSTSQLNLRIRRRKRLVRPWSAQCMVCINIAKKYQNTNEQKTKKRRNKLRTRGARTQN